MCTLFYLNFAQANLRFDRVCARTFFNMRGNCLALFAVSSIPPPYEKIYFKTTTCQLNIEMFRNNSNFRVENFLG